MWLTNSSIGRKVIMSVSGIALILFLTFHGCMNLVALFSEEGYNMVCEMLGANWYAVAATVALGALVVVHFVYALILTMQNRKARGNNRYAVTSKPEKVEWASQNMFVLGIIIVLGLLLHLFNFWYNMMLAELVNGGMPFINEVDSASNGYAMIAYTFKNPGLFRALPCLDCRPVVPPDPRLLERYADPRLERQDLVQPLALHR